MAIRYTLSLAAMGFIITLLVVYVNQNMQNTYEQNLPYVNLGDNLKNRTTKGHLWFEEAMAGDASVDFEKDVIQLFTSSRDILQGAYDGQETELGAFKLSDEETQAILKEAILGVENLTASAHQRWDFKKQSASAVIDSTSVDTGESAGGKLDQEFDAAYEGLQVSFDKLVEHVNKKVKADSSFLSILSWVAVVLILGIFAVLCFFVYRILRRMKN